MDDRNGIGPQSGYIAKITNDARETEMEENMGQVNTMIGNLRNMAIDMGSELENQNRQIDRINRKVSNGKRVMASECAAPASKLCTAVVGRLGMALKKTIRVAIRVCRILVDIHIASLDREKGASQKDHWTRSKNRAFNTKPTTTGQMTVLKLVIKNSAFNCCRFRIINNINNTF